MTIRELRQVLTEIDNQGMTVQELRAILFEQEEQDKTLEEMDLFKMTYGKLPEYSIWATLTLASGEPSFLVTA